MVPQHRSLEAIKIDKRAKAAVARTAFPPFSPEKKKKTNDTICLFALYFVVVYDDVQPRQPFKLGAT